MKNRISLNGYWNWNLPGGSVEKRCVPGNYLCVGQAIYTRDMELDNLANKRIFLCFDGIHYTGDVSVNGKHVGDMLPYVPYRFDITDQVKEGTNTVKATISDITAHYGPTGGWEDYGGISRDVYLEVCDICEISDWQWIVQLENNYGTAICTLKIWTEQHSMMKHTWSAEINLSLAGRKIHSQTIDAQYETSSSNVSLEFVVEHPMLWSCDMPVLYDLEIKADFSKCQDVIATKVGFREFRVKGSRFMLNGKDTFLKGVARHEAWGDDQGFALTPEQIEQDLIMIKQMGGNYCRLVHYPHQRQTIEIADRIGLLISEEPGLWWNDLADTVVTRKALEVMRRTVLRDRNSPSVICWLLFNECHLKGGIDYLSTGKKMIQELDETRPISAANAIEAHEAKDVFDQAGMDFYTIHPYAYEPKAMIDNLEVLRGKPVVFTEWGGWLIHNNQNLIKPYKRVIARYSHNRDPEPNLAGIAWWQWQDVFQFSRGLPGCEDGLLSDGLVDRFRHRKPMLSVMAEFFDLIDRPLDPGYKIDDLPNAGRSTDAPMQTINLEQIIQQPLQAAAWEDALVSSPHFEKTRLRRHIRNTGPILPIDCESLGGLIVDLRKGRPVILNDTCKSISIPVNIKARCLHMIGQTSYFDGYPLRGEFGDMIGRYILTYDDGVVQEIPLRNGIEMSSSSMIAINSRVNPQASHAKRLAVVTIDSDFECYQIAELVINTNPTVSLTSIGFEVINSQFFPLLYGITAELS